MWGEIKSLYGPKFADTVAYMLQSSEYGTRDYLRWFWRVRSFSNVSYRRGLVRTKAARLLLYGIRLGQILFWATALYLLYLATVQSEYHLILLAVGILIAAPLVLGHLIIAPLLFGRLLMKPANERRIHASARKFEKHRAKIIAIAGSYGKTSMKEILTTMLGLEFKVAATSGNQNVPISHARFVESLDGDEDILIIEYGEGEPGDIERFAKNTHPDIGVITGLAPAHLDRYKTLEAAAKDILALADHLGGNEVYINGDSKYLSQYVKPEYHLYNSAGVLGWKVSGVKNGLDGLCFGMSKSGSRLMLTTGLLGAHMVGPVALAAALAAKLGVPSSKIEAAAKLLKPYQHRMQPYRLADAWVIDDTYNGNIEGMSAGLSLLKELKAKRKIYVTPGLVGQGQETERVHQELGRMIAQAAPDQVVLIKHSVTRYIQEGLEAANYKGQLMVEERPLEFYSNLEHWLAAGDVVLMQNDWTDNYN